VGIPHTEERLLLLVDKMTLHMLQLVLQTIALGLPLVLGGGREIEIEIQIKIKIEVE
jgi:hypothetical protein